MIDSIYFLVTCEEVSVLKISLFIKYLLEITFIIVPIVLIIFISIDFFKNVIAVNGEDMNKNLKIVINRLLYAVFMFLVPTVIGVAINVIGNFDVDYQACLTVTPKKIKSAITKQKNACLMKSPNHEWDEVNSTCIRIAEIPELNYNINDGKIIYSNSGSGSSAPIAGITKGGIQTEAEAETLQKKIEEEWIHTKVHIRTGQYQSGPFIKYWKSSYTGSLNKFQCTWWANGRASMYLEKFGTKYKRYPTLEGNGGDYYRINKENGWFEYGQSPRPNSIVSWRGGSYGHVAYVEGVTSDGIWISDAGSGVTWRGVHKIGLDGLEWSTYPLNGYIYLDSPKK